MYLPAAFLFIIIIFFNTMEFFFNMVIEETFDIRGDNVLYMYVKECIIDIIF